MTEVMAQHDTVTLKPRLLFSCPNEGWAVETTPGFNWLKPPRSICQKVVNTNLSGRLKFLNGRFGGGLRF